MTSCHFCVDQFFRAIALWAVDLCRLRNVSKQFSFRLYKKNFVLEIDFFLYLTIQVCFRVFMLLFKNKTKIESKDSFDYNCSETKLIFCLQVRVGKLSLQHRFIYWGWTDTIHDVFSSSVFYRSTQKFSVEERVRKKADFKKR